MGVRLAPESVFGMARRTHLEVSGAPHLKNVDVMSGGHLDLLFSAEIPSIISRELESAEPTVQTSRQLTVRRLISSTNDVTERAVA